MSGQVIESELKLIADDDSPLVALATQATLGGARLAAAQVVDELDRYLDTVDHRLASQGWACRLRTREGSTTVSLKGPASHAADSVLHRRPELNGAATTEPMPSAWPRSEARDLLDAMSAGAQLFEQFRLVQARTERAVMVRGRRAGILSLDRVTVTTGGVPMGMLHVVELELDQAAASSAREVDRLSQALQQIRGLRPDPMTKIQHALALIAASPS